MYVPHERRKVILALLEQHGYLRTASVADELGVTEETVRNDLIYLQKQGLLQRVRAGARYLPPDGNSLGDAFLSSQYISVLHQYLPQDGCIYADDTPLLRRLLTHLRDENYSVVTPSLSLAQSLCVPALPHRVLLPAGELDKQTHLIDGGDECAMSVFLNAHGPVTALLCPSAADGPCRISYHHALQARWANAASRAAEHCLLVILPDVESTLTANNIHCTPERIIGPANLPPEFREIPHDLIPIITVEDIREASHG